MIDLNDDQDATWGGKRTRYLYNYTMQCSDLISNTDDSDVTESVHSVQSKTTSNYIEQNLLVKYFVNFYFLFIQCSIFINFE